MELNNLLTNFKKTKSDSKKYLALEIGFDSVKSAVWDISGTKPQVVQIGSVEQVDPTTDELLTAVDASISKATLNISPEPDQVVFSVPDSWVEGNDIVKDKKKILRDVSKKLELKPLGFVVTVEALVQHLNVTKGSPPTVILLGLSLEDVMVTIVRNGQIEGNHLVGRSDDLGSDVEEGIARFGSISNLPPNIILYDGHTNLEELKQTLVSYNWQERLPFLHIPKISTLSPEDTISAVVTTGGEEVITSLQVTADGDMSAENHNPSTVEVEETEGLPQPPDLSEEFGFKVSHPSTKDETTKENLDQEESTDNQEFLEEAKNVVPVDDDVLHPPEDPDEEDFDGEYYESPRDKTRKKLKTGFNRFSSIFSAKLPIVIIILLLFGGILVSGAIAAYWYIPKAQVTIYLEPKTINREITFTIDPNIDQIDLGSSVIPGRPNENEVSAEATVEATGEKLVGDKATGTIELFNRTDSVKSFSAGTRLTADNSLVYILDEDVQIASASSQENADLSVTTLPSSEDVSVTAEDIGAKYNLASGIELKVANFDASSFLAKSKGELQGGSSRQITAVSEEDVAQLREMVNQELEDKATNVVAETPDTFISAVILPNQDEAPEESLSAEAGDEANQVTLSTSYNIKTMTYKRSDLQQLLETVLADAIPQNYTLLEQESAIDTSKVVVQDDGSIQVTSTTQAGTVPIIEPLDVANNIRGRYPDVTESYFKGLPGFSRVEIDIRPQLPPKLKTFPRVASNITVEIQVNSK